VSRAFVKEGDGAGTGSVTDRFYQGLLELSDAARALIARRQADAWLRESDRIQLARDSAQNVLGADSYREIFDAAAERAGDPPQSPTWWAIGEAATAIAGRKRLSQEAFATLVGPLGVALPWLKDANAEA
jgi:NADPH-dependent ferric siderophore reductase